MAKAGHVGTCVNSFDRRSGECVVPHLPYRDASHFASATENASKVSKEHFLKHAEVPKHLEPVLHKKSTEFLHDKEHGVHMMHDTHKDVHHFFTEQYGMGGAYGLGEDPPMELPRFKGPMGETDPKKTVATIQKVVRAKYKRKLL